MKNFQTKFSSFAQMLEVLNTEKACREFLEQVRWGSSPICPHCGSQNKDHYKLKQKGEFKGLRKCSNCRERFTVRVNTIFHGSPIPLRKWFIAIYIFSSHKKGISSLQLHRDLGVTQKTAWFMLHRIRAMLKTKAPFMLENEVEVDETYVGGKNKNRHFDKKVKYSQGRSFKDKTPVLGIVQRGGRLIAKTVENVQAKTLTQEILNNVKKGVTVYTDEWTGYKEVSKTYNHSIVKHAQYQYVNGRAHTNTIEGFWSFLKRGILGIYHFTSRKHLNRYLDEFSYRYNTRHLTQEARFENSLSQCSNRLKYRRLISKQGT